MNCPKCSRLMVVKVIPSLHDGEFNMLICSCGHAQSINQPRPEAIREYRARVSRLMEAA